MRRTFAPFTRDNFIVGLELCGDGRRTRAGYFYFCTPNGKILIFPSPSGYATPPKSGSAIIYEARRGTPEEEAAYLLNGNRLP